MELIVIIFQTKMYRSWDTIFYYIIITVGTLANFKS